jgi:hypothetical protein
MLDGTMWLLVFLVACGLMGLAFGVREVFLQGRLRRVGVRVWGNVVRYERSTTGEDGTPVLFAVVGYDAEGRREIKATSSGTRRWPIGHPVPVVHLPGAPAKARIDLGSERRARAVVIIMCGGGFTVIPIVIMILRLRHG